VVEIPQLWRVRVLQLHERNDSPRIDGACAVFFNTLTKIYSQDKRFVSGRLPSLAFTCFVSPFYQMSDSDADTEDYEPPEERYLEADDWMEGYNPEDRDVINYNRLYLETKRARLVQQALQIEEAKKDTDTSV
jgi:hypothetical protein